MTDTNEPILGHFLVTALVIYERDGNQKQRHVNILAELETEITKMALAGIHKAVATRVMTENGLEQNQLRDVVILNITFLGAMTSTRFHGTPEELAATVAGVTETTPETAPEAAPA